MRGWKKTEGAISVFLVIILVPCLFISALFVDVGRVYLSNGMAQSAADLALNSVMTNYDSILNEYYGLIASCQSMDEFYSVSEDYFKRTISSKGLSDEEIKLLSDTFTDVLDSTIEAYTQEGVELKDLLKAEVDGDVTISPVEDANLANPSLLKEQVVEFMKYRGPVAMTTALVDLFYEADGKTPKEAVSAILKADEDKPVLKAQEEYHNSMSELLEKGYKTYSYLYTNYSKNPTENKALQDEIDKLGTALEKYRALHDYTVAYFYNTDKAVPYNHAVVAIDEYASDYTAEGLKSKIVFVENEEDSEASTEEDTESSEESTEDINYITWTDLSKRIEDLKGKISAFETAISDFYKSVEGIGYTEGTTHDVQYWGKVDYIIYGRGSGGKDYRYNVASTADAMIKSYEILKKSMECTPYGTDFPADYETTCNTLLKKVVGHQSKYLKKDSTKNPGTDKYLVLAQRLETISNRDYKKVDQDNVTMDGKSLDTYLSDISQSLIKIKEFCKNKTDILDVVINGDSSKGITKLSNFTTLATEYETAYNTYSGKLSSNPQTTLKEKLGEDLEENKYSEKVNATAVTAMETRLKNIRKQYQDVLDAIDGMKYGNKKIVDITKYKDFKAEADKKVNKDAIGTTKSSVSQYCETTWSSLIVPNLSSGAKVVTMNETDAFNLLLKPEAKKYAVPDLYMFFYETFGPPNDTAVEEQKKQMDEAKKAANKNNATSDKVSGKIYNSDAKNITSIISKTYEKKFGMGTGINALVAMITDLASGDFDKIRDKAYIASYIFEMFSYGTYENEGLYDLYKEKNGASAVLSLDGQNFDEKYKTMMGKTDGTERGTWLSSTNLDSYNKSLTNKLINKSNNAAYRCELEYLLYGKSTNKENVNAACTDIFTLRLLLNTISGFVNFWPVGNATSNIFETIAQTASAASCFVIPAVVIKAALVMILVASETCNDMERLSCGFPVELYKVRHDDWMLTIGSSLSEGGGISGVISSFDGTCVENKDEGFTYGDYVKIFVCMSIWGDAELGGSALSETVMRRVGDLIQTNVRHVTGQKGYLLSNAITHFKLEATMKVDPLVVNSPYFYSYNQGLEESDSWLKYKVSAIRGY